ncbi:hypothetical protein [Thermococcus paralvinellae]|uniref:hypothetical protein n=1 Tax=Thermococcus paralvinellae TaxID=582419 RepID=UPI000B25016B|nr:hypothetical protein [Thermococcus paralvinellae]
MGVDDVDVDIIGEEVVGLGILEADGSVSAGADVVAEEVVAEIEAVAVVNVWVETVLVVSIA